MSSESRKIGWLQVKQQYVLPADSADDDYVTQDERNESKKRKRGQNANRQRPNFRESLILCPKYAKNIPCSFGDSCKFSHSVKDYIAQKEEDIGDVCPVFETIGVCNDGWRCRWLSGHIRKAEEGERGSVDGWMLVVDEEKAARTSHEELNRVDTEALKSIKQNAIPLPLSEEFLRKLEEEEKSNGQAKGSQEKNGLQGLRRDDLQPVSQEEKVEEAGVFHDAQDQRATFTEPTLRQREKRRIHWSGLHVLAPLTTIGNPPFRRLLRSYGAQLTYSEMALSQPLLSAQKNEWALPRAHPTELQTHSGPPNSYYGVQIAGGKIPAVVKTTELLTRLCGDGIDTIDLNCGCPLDMVFKMGAGSALLDNQGKMIKMLRGMVLVSGEIPVTCKIRMGVYKEKNTAQKLLRRLVVENIGVSAVTLHGRSRQQRYSKAADWEYIAECAALIKRAKQEMADVTDSSYNNLEYGESQRMAFIGNGDVNSYIDFYNAIDNSGVDTTMIARGAIIKPWIFEEIAQRQHIDKSATERLEMLKQFAHWGLEHWGSDAYGVSNTRRFFCEFMSFFHRYVPLGILDHESIPPHLHDRAPKWCGRSELETLLGSTDSRDWVKVSEMFLGKTPEGWYFTPKHKSNSVDAEG